jgi:hypothetical protein
MGIGLWERNEDIGLANLFPDTGHEAGLCSLAEADQGGRDVRLVRITSDDLRHEECRAAGKEQQSLR